MAFSDKSAALPLQAMVQFVEAIRRPARFRLLVLGILAAGLTCAVALAYYVRGEGGPPLEIEEESPQWASIAHVDVTKLATVGRNTYFNLEPGDCLHYTDGALARTVTVRRKTKTVDGVETRVVEEKDDKDGQPTQVVWKYYAIDKTTKALYCFGVHVQTYTNGELASHRSWRSGAEGAVFRLAMPAAPKVGDSLVRGHAKRVYEVTDVAAQVVTPAGTFTNCLRIQAKDGSEKGADKFFAPGVGLVKDGQFNLLKIVQTVPRKSGP